MKGGVQVGLDVITRCGETKNLIVNFTVSGEGRCDYMECFVEFSLLFLVLFLVRATPDARTYGVATHRRGDEERRESNMTYSSTWLVHAHCISMNMQLPY